MNFFNSPISPVADDLLLMSVADYAIERTGLLAPPSQGARHRLVERLMSGVFGKNGSDGKDSHASPIVRRQVFSEDDTIPPSAFLTLSTITIQLSMLRQLSKSGAADDLALVTCESLLLMLQPMPIRALKSLSRWEAGVLNQITMVMQELAGTSTSLQNKAKSLFLSFAYQQSSLSSVLRVVEAIMINEQMELATQTIDIIKRYGQSRVPMSMACNWLRFETSFPMRAEPLHESEHEQRFIAASCDSSFLYVSTASRLVKVGSGDDRILGASATLPGHVYAASDFGGCPLVLEGTLYSAFRRKGSLEIEIFERDGDTLEFKDAFGKISLPFPDRKLVEREGLITLSTTGDDKGGRTISYAGPNGWIVGSSVRTYFEVTIRDESGSLSVGWLSPGFTAGDNLRLGGGGDKFCWAFDCISRETLHDGIRSPWGVIFRKGDVLGCALDADAQGNITISFSRNSSWESPMGKAFDLPNLGMNGHFRQFRPFLSYAGDDADAPILNVGGVYGDQSEKDSFHFPAPRTDFAPVCRVITPGNLADSYFPSPFDLASIPPIASDGHFLYCAWIQGDEYSRASSALLTIDTYAIVNKLDLVQVRKKKLRRAPSSSTTIKTFLEGFSTWRMMSSGSSVFLAMVSVTQSGQGHYRSTAIQISEHDEMFCEMAWTVGDKGLDIPQAVCYDARLNVVWGWDEKLNILYAFENASLGRPSTLPMVEPTLQPGPQPVMDVLGFLVATLSRLASPFLLEVPLNLAKSHCAVCDNQILLMSNHCDLFLEPFDPNTIPSLTRLTERCFAESRGDILEGLLELLLVNIHVAVCPRHERQMTASSFDSVSLDLLKNLLLPLVSQNNDVIRSLAERILCEGIPLFWSSCESKVGLLAQAIQDKIPSTVLQRVLRSLNDQLLQTKTFPQHRALFDDSLLNGILHLVDHADPLVADAACGLVVGLLAAGFRCLRQLATEDTTAYNRPPVKSKTEASVSAGIAALFAMGKLDEEETKDEEGSGVSRVDPPLSPSVQFDDIIALIMQLFDRCVDTKFASCLSSKVLPFALVTLDMLIGAFVTGPKATRSFLKIDSQTPPMRIASLALHIIQSLDSLDQDLSSANSFSFTRFEIVSRMLTASSFLASAGGAVQPSADGSCEERRVLVHIPFASKLSITFDARSELNSKELFRFNKPGGKDQASESIGDEKGYTGRALPGIDLPPLTSPFDQVECLYTTQSPGSDSDGHDRFALTVMAQRIVKRKVDQRFYMFHVLESCKALLSNVMSATVASAAYCLNDTELDLIRWIQNALFSGGLRSIEDSPPRPGLKRGSRASVYSSGDMRAFLQEEAESMLNDMLTMKIEPPSLSASLLAGMRLTLNRVPFDQGRPTQPAMLAIAAALIRSNGMESEAVTFAKAVAAVGAEFTHIRAPPRLRALWSAAQQIRAWCDSLVVNGRAKRHLEACGIDWSISSSGAEESKDEDSDTFDAEDREYAALCQLVVTRCEFLVRSVNPPPFLRLGRKKEDALARWHFLRERFCPRASEYVRRESLGAVLRGVRALVAARRQPSSPVQYKTLSPAVPMPSPFPSPSVNFSPGTTLEAAKRSLKKLVSSDDLLQPIHTRMGKSVDSLTRRASLSSWGSSAMKRKPSWMGVETIEELAKSSASSPASSVGGASARYRRGSAASSTAGGGGVGFRVKSRAEGGLRRASVDGLVDELDVVDVARADHDLSLSESVLTFVECPSAIRKRDLLAVLKARNERAQARSAGLSIVVAIAQGTNFQSNHGRDLFEYLLQLTMTTIRIAGSNSSTGEPNAMEAHFMTDLTGCSVLWREKITAVFLAFLRIAAHQLIRVSKNFAFRPQRKACDHIELLLDGVVLDYVESDYSLLFRSNVVEGIQACMSLPKFCRVPLHSWKVFELFFRRCVVDHCDNSSLVGHIFQQQLMDVLMDCIRKGPYKCDSTGLSDSESKEGVDEEEDEDDVEGDVAPYSNDSPKAGSISQTVGASGPGTVVFLNQDAKLPLFHGAARYLSRSIRIGADFSVCVKVYHPSKATLTPGKLLCIGGDRMRRWSWFEVEVDADGRLGVRITAWTGSTVKVMSQVMLSEDQDMQISLTVSVASGRLLSIFATKTINSPGEKPSASHDWCELDAVPEPNSFSMDSSAGAPKPPSPTLSRARRLSSRSSDIENQIPCLLSGRLIVGGRPGMGTNTLQGVFVSDLRLVRDKALVASDAFPQGIENVSVRAINLTDTATPDIIYPRRQYAPEYARILTSLELALSAIQKQSLIALARLSVPSAQNDLLRIVLDAQAPVRVRITGARVLRRVLKDSVPSDHILQQLGRCVTRAMPPEAVDGSSIELVPEPRATAAVADEIVDLVAFLCEKPGNWSLFVANWVVRKVGALVSIPLDEKLSVRDVTVREACAAMAMCGGRLEGIRIGGRAIVNSSALSATQSTQSLISAPIVRIIAHGSLGNVAVRDVTEACKFRVNGELEVGGHKGLNCLVPSVLLVESPAPIRSVEIFVESHRLESPRSIVVRVGSKHNNLGKARVLDVSPREGWFTVYLHEAMIQSRDREEGDPMSLLAPQGEGADDEFVCNIRIKGVWGYSSQCRISRFKVKALVTQAEPTRLGEDAQREDRYICVAASEDETLTGGGGDNVGDTGDVTYTLLAREEDQAPAAAPTVSRGGSSTGRQQFVIAYNEASASSSSNSELDRRFLIHSESSLVPWAVPAPMHLLEGVYRAAHQDVLEAFHALLASLSKRIESNRGKERRLAMDVQVRLLKVVANMLAHLAKDPHAKPSVATASFLLQLAKTHNAKSHPVPVAARFKRNAVPESWKVRFVSSSTNEDSVRFEPLTATGTPWPHRFIIADVDLTLTGIHSWTFTLNQDTARGDESVVFGLCCDRSLLNQMCKNQQQNPHQLTREGSGSGLGTASTSVDVGVVDQNQQSTPGNPSTVEEDDLDLLVPSSKFHFLRAFDGSAIGNQPPSPMLCVRVGDSLRCELDLDRGTFSVAVNSRPLTCIFTGVTGPVWPCVGTYSERGTVVVSLSNLRCTPPHPRRKLASECRNLLDVQVEALARQAFKTLVVEGDDASAEPEERSLTFIGAPMEDPDGHDMMMKTADGRDEVDSDDDEIDLNNFKTSAGQPGGKTDSASELLTQKSPVLYRVEDSTAPLLSAEPVRLANGQSESEGAAGMTPLVASAMLAPPPPPLGLSGIKDTPTTQRVLTPAGRYEALLWELLARLSRNCVDLVVTHWKQGVVPDEFFKSSGLEEAVDALHRASKVETTSQEFLHVMGDDKLVRHATDRIVSLGNLVLGVKRSLRKPRRKQPLHSEMLG